MDKSTQFPNNTSSSDGGIGHERSALPVALIHDTENMEPATIQQSIAQKIQRPNLIKAIRFWQIFSRLAQFFLSSSVIIALSSSASAKSFFNFAFSDSGDFNRLASDTSIPPYFAFQLQNVTNPVLLAYRYRFYPGLVLFQCLDDLLFRNPLLHQSAAPSLGLRTLTHFASVCGENVNAGRYRSFVSVPNRAEKTSWAQP